MGPVPDNILTRIDEFVERVREHWHVPGVALAVVRREEPIHLRAYGMRNLATAILADENTAFNIGSCSKSFTATLAAILVDEKRIGWDDPICRYLPEFRLYDPWVTEHVTLRDMLAQRTGLSRLSLSEFGSDLSRAEVLRRAVDIQPIAGFRDQFTYCNVNFVAAAAALASATGQPFESLITSRIHEPLQLKNSTVLADAWETNENIALPHYVDDNGARVVPPPRVDNGMGAGTQALSARDAVAWLQMQLGDGVHHGTRLVSETNICETHVLQAVSRGTWFDGYGLGWFIGRHDGKKVVFHEGWNNGHVAFIRLDPDENLARFVAANVERSHVPIAIASFIKQVLAGEEPRDWIAYFDEVQASESSRLTERFEKERKEEPISASRWSLEDFIGTYGHKGFGTLRIDPGPGCLWFRIEHLSTANAPLVRYSDLCFEYQQEYPALTAPNPLKGDLPWVRFVERDGQISGLTLHRRRLPASYFERINRRDDVRS